MFHFICHTLFNVIFPIFVNIFPLVFRQFRQFLQGGLVQTSRETGEKLIVHSLVRHPRQFLQIHLISLIQIQHGACACRSHTSVRCSNNNHIIPQQVCSDQFVITEEIDVELVGSISRGDEFPIIGVVDIVNVAASNIGDDLVKFDDLFVHEARIISHTNHEVKFYGKKEIY